MPKAIHDAKHQFMSQGSIHAEGNSHGANMNEKYDEIIYMDRHESEKHPRMPRLDRAAQFAPYSALSGYEDAVEETARLTDAKIELDDGEIEKICRLNVLRLFRDVIGE